MDIKTQNIIRIVIFSLLLLALIWTGYRAGGDPCERCVLDVDDKQMDCREMVEVFIEPIFSTQVGMNSNFLNVSLG